MNIRLPLFVFAALLSTDAFAEDSRRFDVSAVVRPFARLQQIDLPREIHVTADDIARGSIDIPAAVQMEVASNSSSGYVLNIQPRLAMFTRAQINGLDAAVQIGPEGATIVQRGQPQRVKQVSMSYRFFLADNIAPGVYPWPLHLSVEPLES